MSLNKLNLWNFLFYAVLAAVLYGKKALLYARHSAFSDIRYLAGNPAVISGYPVINRLWKSRILPVHPLFDFFQFCSVSTHLHGTNSENQHSHKLKNINSSNIYNIFTVQHFSAC